MKTAQSAPCRFKDPEAIAAREERGSSRKERAAGGECPSLSLTLEPIMHRADSHRAAKANKPE